MTSDESRQVVLAFCRHLSDRAFDDMRSLTTDCATWFMNGRPDLVAYAGLFPIDEMMPRLKAFIGDLDSFSFTVTGTTAENDRVAIEAVGRGEQGGKSYENVYMMQFVLKDGSISSVREFLDHASVVNFFNFLAA